VAPPRAMVSLVGSGATAHGLARGFWAAANV
jgi:hypothetical protein